MPTCRTCLTLGSGKLLGQLESALKDERLLLLLVVEVVEMS